MTKPKTHSGFYVTARHDRRTAWLCGPFTGPRGHMAALAMVPAVTHAANRTADPRFAFSLFGTAKLTMPIDQPLPPGTLDIAAVMDDGFIARVVQPWPDR